MPVVRERHVAGAAIVELLHAPRDRLVVAERIAVLDADERDLLAGGVDAAHVGRRQRQLDLVGRDHLRQPVNRLELLDRLLVGARRSLGSGVQRIPGPT